MSALRPLRAISPVIQMADAEEHDECIGTMMRCAAVAKRKGLPCVVTPEEIRAPEQRVFSWEKPSPFHRTGINRKQGTKYGGLREVNGDKNRD